MRTSAFLCVCAYVFVLSMVYNCVSASYPIAPSSILLTLLPNGITLYTISSLSKKIMPYLRSKLIITFSLYISTAVSTPALQSALASCPSRSASASMVASAKHNYSFKSYIYVSILTEKEVEREMKGERERERARARVMEKEGGRD